MHPLHRFVTLACIAAATFYASPVMAQTLIPGGNIINQTWALAGSPYILQGDITIPLGAFLTIQPGVIVRAASTDALGAGSDTSRVEITVNGTLTAVGSAALPITFRSDTLTTSNAWVGIRVNAGSTAVIRNASILHTSGAVVSSAGLAALDMSDVTIQTFSTVGVRSTTGTPALTRLRISGGPIGVEVTPSGTTTLSNLYITGTTFGGVSIPGGSGTISVLNSTIDANTATGISIAATPTVTANITNCIVSSNATGINRSGSASVNASFNNVWNNTTANYVSVVAGVGSISVNPQFLLGNIPQLSATSACIDTGSTTTFAALDLFGTTRPVNGDGIGAAVADIGAHEYVPCASPMISTNPSPSTTRVGRPFTFSVAATGAGLSYQWRRNAVNLSDARGLTGSTTPTLSVDFAGIYDAGSYDCIVSNTCGTATSTAATLTVNPPCPADFNGVAGVSVQDIFDFLAAWFAGCP